MYKSGYFTHKEIANVSLHVDVFQKNHYITIYVDIATYDLIHIAHSK